MRSSFLVPVAVVALSATALSQASVSFTTAQATRGAALYQERCSSCHGEEAQGDGNGITPPLVGLEFRANWGGLPLSALLDRIRTESEQNRSGPLSRPQEADVLAFLLSRNGATAGSADLPADPAVLGALISSLIRD